MNQGEGMGFSESEVNAAMQGLKEKGEVEVRVVPASDESDDTQEYTPPSNEEVDELLKRNDMAPIDEGHVVLEKDIDEMKQGEHNN